jgi:hypothetical protein
LPIASRAAASAGPRPWLVGVDLRMTVQPSVFAGQEMIPLGVVVVPWVLVVGCVVVVRPVVVVGRVVVGGGIVSVDSPVSVSMVIGGPVAVVSGG